VSVVKQNWVESAEINQLFLNLANWREFHKILSLKIDGAEIAGSESLENCPVIEEDVCKACHNFCAFCYTALFNCIV
jgi:hypothetical protein